MRPEQLGHISERPGRQTECIEQFRDRPRSAASRNGTKPDSSASPISRTGRVSVWMIQGQPFDHLLCHFVLT